MAIYKQKKSKFYWCGFADPSGSGKRIRISTQQTTKYLASLVENDLLAKARQHGIDSLRRKVPTLAEFAVGFTQWVKDAEHLAEKTKRYYRQGLDMLKPTRVWGMNLDAITNLDLETIAFPGESNYTANQALSTLRRMLHQAEEKELLERAPKIKLRRVDRRSVGMTMQQAELIASRMKGDPRDVLLVLRGTGMRPVEVYGMRWQYMDLERGLYLNPSGKTKSARRPIPFVYPATTEVLRRRHLAQGQPTEGWVFPSDSVSGHVVSIAKAFSSARKAAGLPSTICIYTARHGYATDLAPVLTMKELMEMLGHTDAKVAASYQHPQVEDIRARLEARTSGRVQ